jgi:WD40 repeat protein
MSTEIKGGREADPPTAEQDSQPEVYGITRNASGFALSRRSFVALPAGVLAGGYATAAERVAKRVTSTEATKPTEGTKSTGGLIRAESCGDFRAHLDGVSSMAMDGNGRLLASGSSDSTIKLWSLPDGALLKTLARPQDPSPDPVSHELVMSQNGKLLASRSSFDATIRLWSLPDGILLKTLAGHSDHVSSLAISPDGKLLVSGSRDKTVKIWSLPRGTLVKTIPEYVHWLAISLDGKLLVSGGWDRTIKVWSLPRGVLRTTLAVEDYPQAVGMTPDGNLLSGGYGKTVIVRSLSDGSVVKTLVGHVHFIHALAATPDGRLVVSGSSDKTVKVWSYADGTLLNTLSGHTEAVSAVAISRDGKLLASGSTDKTIRLWSLPDGQSLGCIYEPMASDEHAKVVTSRIGEPGSAGKCVCDTVTVPAGPPLPAGAECVCNTVNARQPVANGVRQEKGGVCSCNLVCTCQSVCGCQSVGGGHGGHYWRPN